jgi:hypothetical protein
MVQNKLMDILIKDFYDMKEVANLLKINPFQSRIISTEMHKYKLGYKKIDIIKRIMGGKFY